MSVLVINGVSVPTPSDMQVGIMDISKADRNTKGDMILERIATKRKLQLTWKFLTDSDLSSILGAVSGVSFNVTYPDPQSGSRTAKFYCGDRNAGVLDIQNSILRYKDVKFDLIEM